MYYIYIIYSHGIDRYNIGSTDDLLWRLERHNLGWGRYSKRGIPWKLVHSEEYDNKSEALKREREIKNRKSRKYIEDLIQHAGGRPAQAGSFACPCGVGPSKIRLIAGFAIYILHLSYTQKVSVNIMSDTPPTSI